ncbi:universal stress protein [Mumia sp. DW29H23]|uniref:universal stress protein n=1 Tax=Mumia sp. DW29H23 TaxID=3421241 RepID=UPI003D690D49
MTDEPDRRPILAGVNATQDASVPRQAAALATRMDADLVCAWIDTTRLPREGDGTDAVTVPVDPDVVGSDGTESEVLARVRAALDGATARWTLVRASGEVVSALRTVADTYDAALVVVGTRRPGIVEWVDEALGGSVAGRLAHTQKRPVVVVPQGRPE